MRTVGEHSGTTAVFVVVTETEVICGNVGDSRAVLGRRTDVFALSDDHKPYNMVWARSRARGARWRRWMRA